MRPAVFCLIFIGFSYWWISRDRQVAIEKNDPVKKEVVEKVEEKSFEQVVEPIIYEKKPVVPMVNRSNKININTKKNKTPGAVWPKLPDAGQVRFEVVDGYAIGYGDVVLGRVKEQGGSRFGFYRPTAARIWPSNEIPYLFAEGLANKAEVEKAIRHFNEKTVIKFVPHSDQPNTLEFVKFEKNCASYLGMTGGRQPVFLSPDCKSDQIIHELMHALGFVHEQSREDRDNYIEVLYDNIDEEFANQFDIAPGSLLNSYRGSVFHFDYDSVMMYLPTAFAAEPGLKTMRSLTNTVIPTKKNGLSESDIERLYDLYRQ